MFRSKALLALALVMLFASISGCDTGKSSLRITAKKTGRGGGSKIPNMDRARALTQSEKSNVSSVGIVQGGYLIYTAEVGVGSPPTNYTLMIDTGSSNTWVGANKTYKPTSSSHNTGHAFRVRYGSGNVSGDEWADTVTLSADLVITNQSIGVANTSYGFQSIDVDGILGIGPRNLTANTVSDTTVIPTVMDNLHTQGAIAEEIFGVYFIPASEPGNGILTFGGYDDDVIKQPMEYVPLTTTGRPSMFWGINQSVTYGNETILRNVSGIVDTGTTLVYFPTNAFQKYQILTGAIMDSSTGLLTITRGQYDKLKPLTFYIGDRSYTLTANAQIWPRALNEAIGGEADMIYLIVNNLGLVDPDIGFINGYTFLERFYSVYDATNRRIGFACTQYTDCNCN